MKQVAILGTALAAALVGSYLTWTAPEDDGKTVTDVVVVRTTPDKLSGIRWEEEGKTIALTRPTDDRGTYVWITSSEANPIAEKLSPEDALDGVPAKPEASEAEPLEQAFAGNEQADDIWEAFAPLYGLRELATPAGTDLAEYGLDDVKTTVTLTIGGTDTVLELGGEAFGTRDRYVRANGKVYLIDDKTVRPLQFASTRLVERRLYPLDEKEMAEVVVQRGSDTRAFVQVNADDRAAAFWADATEPDARDTEASTWLGKLFRARVRSYVDADDAPADLTPVFAFEIRGNDAKWPVQVLATEGERGTEYYAKAAYNRSLVMLSRTLAEEAVADLDTLFDGKDDAEAVDEDADPNDAPPAAPVVPEGEPTE